MLRRFQKISKQTKLFMGQGGLKKGPHQYEPLLTVLFMTLTLRDNCAPCEAKAPETVTLKLFGI